MKRRVRSTSARQADIRVSRHVKCADAYRDNVYDNAQSSYIKLVI